MCAHARWRGLGAQGGRFGCSGGAERGDPGRRRHVGGVVDRGLGVGDGGGLLDRAGGAAERDLVKARELEVDPPPGLISLALGDADQQQREPADQHVRADVVLEAVEHRAELERALEIAESAFGFEQVLVAQRDVLG